MEKILPMKLIKEGMKVIGVTLYKTLASTFTKNFMSVDEARNILNVSKNENKERLYEKYKKLVEINSPENRGSRYLKEKIENAYFILKQDHGKF